MAHAWAHTTQTMPIAVDSAQPPSIRIGVDVVITIYLIEPVKGHYLARTCAGRGKVSAITLCACTGGKVIVFQSPKKILRWGELAPSRTSEHIGSFEDTPISLTCICYWANSLPLVAISAVFLLSSPICQVWRIQHMAKMNESWTVQSVLPRRVCACRALVHSFCC